MYIEKLTNRFPPQLNEDMMTIENTLNLSSMHRSYMPFEISLENNILIIPTRIYTDEGQLDNLNKLTIRQKEMVFCLFSRHHDGFVREKCLKELFASKNLFVIPYILQLLGEYVIEIIEVIYQHREEINHDNLIIYILENPEHYEKTKQRVYSYWDCYYRMAYPKYKRGVKPKGETYLDYPGIRMIKYINLLLSNNKL